ncbi:ankyrin repeat domain-containing protein 27-like [Liolophura sinensis]|uniref:ankyrin repeat domain-containing protein 27-like n=1 Tax=Liolophura sinensis TaxID=3198878 RepID=UPI0031586EF4
MSRYDEDLLENPFYLGLQNEHKELFVTATANRWIICTPRYSSVHKKTCALIDFQDHILVPFPDCDTEFKSASDKKISIEDNAVKTGKGFQLEQSVPILFEEVFYNNSDESYRVICIDRLLTVPKDETVPEEDRPESPHSFEDCTDLLWGHSGGRKTQDTLDKTLMTFLQAYDNLEGENLRGIMDVAVAQFTKAMQIVLKDSTVRRSAKHSGPYMDNLKLAVETYMMHTLHKKLFRSISSCVASQDSKLNKITRNLSELQLKDMGIKQQFSKNIPAAKRELSKLNKYSTPLGKLFCVKRVVNALTKPPKQSFINSDSVEEQVDMLTTDDFLPILIFLVVKSEVPNWMANLVYMKNFHFAKSSNHDEYGYFLASIEAALEHIETGRLKELVTGTNAAKLERWMQLSVNVSGEATVARQDSNSSASGNSAIETLFQVIRLGDEAGLRTLLSRKAELAEEAHLKLCHPLCSCDKCERILAQSRTETMLATPFSRDDRGYTALHVAAVYGQAGMIDILAKHKAAINATDYLGSAPLHLACHRGFQNVSLLLLHFRADPTVTDNDGNTPLHLCAANGHEDCVKALLFFDATAKTIDVNAVNDMGDTPLHLAAKWGYEKIVEALLENGARVDIRNRKKQLPISCAHNVRVQAQLQQTEKDILGENATPLSPKARADSIKSVNSRKLKRTRTESKQSTESSTDSDLVQDSTDSKKVDKLLKAVKSNDVELVRFYLGWTDDSEEDAEIDFTRPLCHPLCQCEKCQPIQKHNSSSSGVHVNSQNAEGMSALHVASVHGHVELVDLIVHKGGNLGAQTQTQTTALHLATEQGHLKVVQILVEKGAKLNTRDYQGNTPLHRGAMTGAVDTVRYLIQSGANYNQTNFRGNSPLHEAVSGNKLEVARVLLEAGAFVMVTNNKHLTPLQLAVDKPMHKLLSMHLQQIVPMSPMQAPYSQEVGTVVSSGPHTDQTKMKGSSKERSPSGNAEVVKMFGQQNGIVPGRELISPQADDLGGGTSLERNIVKSGSGIMKENVGESSGANNTQSSDKAISRTPAACTNNLNSPEIRYSSFEDMIQKKSCTEDILACNQVLDESSERDTEVTVTGTGVTLTSAMAENQEFVTGKSVETSAEKTALDCG